MRDKNKSHANCALTNCQVFPCFLIEICSLYFISKLPFSLTLVVLKMFLKFLPHVLSLEQLLSRVVAVNSNR